jgi:hypothetical protein
MRTGIVCLFVFQAAGLTFSAMGAAQAPAAVPDAPTPQAKPSTAAEPSPSESYFYHMGVLCGVGASASSAGTLPTTGCGAGATLVPFPFWVEVGVMGPQANRSPVSGYVSVEQNIPLARMTVKYLPMAIIGYSRLFETGNAFDYGLALGLPRFGRKGPTSDSLRIEVKDYWTFANPAQHNVMLRVGWMSAEAD